MFCKKNVEFWRIHLFAAPNPKCFSLLEPCQIVILSLSCVPKSRHRISKIDAAHEKKARRMNSPGLFESLFMRNMKQNSVKTVLRFIPVRKNG